MNGNVKVGGDTAMTTGQEPTSDAKRNADESAKRLSMLATLWRMREETQTERNILLKMMPPDIRSGYQEELDALMWAYGLCLRDHAQRLAKESGGRVS